MAFPQTTELLEEALALHRRGAVAEAAVRYGEVLRAEPGNADAHYYMGMMSCQEGRLAEGAELARKALASNPRHARAHVLLGRALSGLGRNDEALASFAQAITLAPDLAQAHSHLADTLSDLGRDVEAVDSYERTLALAPDAIEDRFNLGLALHALGRREEAVSSFDRAVAGKPDFAQARLARANVLLELGRLDDALQSVDGALAIEPRLAEAWLCRGSISRDLKRYDDAFAAYEAALALQPDLAEAWLGRGNALFEHKRYDDAVAAYDRALALKPELTKAWLGRGAVFFDRKQYDDASTAFNKALALSPDLAEAWLGRGNVLFEREQHDDAIAAYDRALSLNADLPEAWLGRGNVLTDVKRHDDALSAYDRALALKPDFAEAWFGRGNVFFATGRDNDALAAFDRALASKSDLADAWLGRGNSLLRVSQHYPALAAIDRALELKPDSAEAWVSRGVALCDTNRPTEALAAFDEALAIVPNLSTALSNRIFALDFASDAGFEEQQKARDDWWRKVGAEIAGKSQVAHGNSCDPDRRIKLGYVSGDFRKHSAAFCFRPILLNHDKTRFEVTCYSCSPVADEVTEDFRRAADRWRDVAQMSDDDFCELIQADQIDILVDLSGHTAGHRLGVFARKPAPLQVSAGATGTGLPTIDYLFSDPVACPQAVRHLFAEKVFDLPSIMTIEALPERLEPGDPPVLSKGHVTFGVFNRVSKISDDVVSLWARILHALPQSRILMKHFALDEASMRNRQWERFARHGISADRIVFLGTTSRADHLAAFKDVDISLDPFPQNGGISTLESLQMGVPVVAILGGSISSRAAGAILTSVGMSDWVADTADDYAAIAVKFATMPDHLKALRRELPARLSASAAGNSAIYVRAVEKAHRTIWADYCHGVKAKA